MPAFPNDGVDSPELDLGLPGISGWEVLATLRAEGLDMPVVGTGDHDPETACRACEAGVSEVIT
jgi:DNA-binding NarL/FixJ family response regulator